MNNHNYRLKYNLDFKHGSFTKAEIMTSNMGGTDALFLVSLIYPKDGSLSMAYYSIDGMKDPDTEGEKGLHDNEVLKIVTMLLGDLKSSDTLEESKRMYCAEAFNLFKERFIDGR